MSARQGAEGTSTLFQKLPTRGPARKTRNPHVTVHWPGRRWPPAQSNDVPGPEGSSVRNLGLGHHQQPRGGTEPAGALQGLGEGLPWPWLRLAEVSQRWPSWWLWEWRCSQDWGPGAGSPFGTERMGGLARNPQRCTLGRPCPTGLPSPCWGPEQVRDALGGPLTPSRGKSHPSEEGEGIRPGPEAATRLGTWSQKPARFGRPQLGGTSQTKAPLPPRFVQPVGYSPTGWGAVLCTGRGPHLGLVCLQPTRPQLPHL